MANQPQPQQQQSQQNGNQQQAPDPLTDPLSKETRQVVEEAMVAGAQAAVMAAGKNPQEYKELAQGIAALGQSLSPKIGFGG